MKKRIGTKGLSFLLSGVIVAAALSGCSSNKQPDNADTEAGDTAATAAEVTAGAADGEVMELGMAWWGNQARNERTEQALKKYSELYPEYKVKGEFYQWSDYWSKIATLAAGKKLPDIIQMDISYLSQYVSSGQLLDLKPYIESGQFDASGISETVMQMGEVDGGIYGIAAGVNSPALLYNETLLKENGLTIEDNMSIDDFVNLAQEVYEKTGYRADIFNKGTYMEYWSRDNDLQIVDKKLTGDSPEAYEPYFQLLEDGIKNGWHIPVDIGSGSNGVEDDPLVYGSSPQTMTWCHLTTSNLLEAYQKAAPEGMKLGITTFPAQNPTKAKFLKPSMFFSVSATTEKPDEAVALLNYLINSVEANEILLGERGEPVADQVSQAISGLISESAREAGVYINEVVAPDCSPITPPAPEGSSEVADLLTKLEAKVAYGEVGAEQAAEEYFKKGNEIFSGK